MRSSRLPGKVIALLGGRPALARLIQRLQRAERLDGIVVATTTNPSDDVLEDLAATAGVACFRGSEDDVLDRVLKAAQGAGADVIVEMTGDCPLIDPAIVTNVLEVYMSDDRLDYVTNGLADTYPRGMDVQVFSTRILDEVARVAHRPEDREHVSLHIYEHPDRYVVRDVPGDLAPRHRNVRLTLDTPEDLALIRAVFDELHPANPAFSLDDILALLDRQPDLLKLNRHVVQRMPGGVTS